MDEREEFFLTNIAAGVDPFMAYAATPRMYQPPNVF